MTDLEDLWRDEDTRRLSEPELLRYRSNLLGRDLRITNFGGGNTSAKVRMTDPLTGESVDVLWVKGSGGDLGSATLDSFATLYLDKLEGLTRSYRGREHEDEMPARFAHCTFNLNPQAPSIDTALHALVPHRHVDHLHADAVIALAASANGQQLTREVFGDELAWVDWQRPGFDLGVKVGGIARERPDLKGLVLGGHGLMTWGSSARECYSTTLAVIRRATEWLNTHSRARALGVPVVAGLEQADRHRLLDALAPALRGRLSPLGFKVMHYADSPDVLEFVSAAGCASLAARGTTCPDHFLRTRVRPMFVPFAPERETVIELLERLPTVVAQYRADYTAYYERCKREGSPAMRDPHPVIVLVPGLGLLAFQKDKGTARIAAEFYESTMRIVRWAEGVDRYAPINEQDAFDIEYWSLEEAKLRRAPAGRSLDGRVALITGGAGGIGSAVAARLLTEGAAVVLIDLDAGPLDETRAALVALHGSDRIRTVECDVTNEAAVMRAISHTVREYGGLDILVANAGIASAAPIDETPLPMWQHTLDVLTTGYFLVAREAFRVMKQQQLGGSMVFVGSKNALVASAGASAYGAAKAAAIHLARSLAAEGAAFGIRANVVNPDAVIRGSRIWSGAWRAERAAANQIDPDEVEEFYRQRSLLKRSVFPEDVAEAVYFFASDRSAKSTGNILNVDGGMLAAFPR
ncbi:MAG: bifunctional rhamnulose-1-phosphate aldolase/short-chain dehydrogenase [Vicinamibacterales bacterium]